MARKPVAPLKSGWVLADGLPVFHRFNLDAGPKLDAMVHVHGFGISGLPGARGCPSRTALPHLRARSAGDGTEHQA